MLKRIQSKQNFTMKTNHIKKQQTIFSYKSKSVNPEITVRQASRASAINNNDNNFVT